MSYAQSMAIVAVTVFSAAAVIAWVGRERHAVEFGAAPDAGAAATRASASA
jgi:hypothetical protein